MRKISASTTNLDQRASLYISERLYWFGRISRSDLMRDLDVASAKASKLLSAYCRDHPGQIMARGKGYVASQSFCPEGIAGEKFLHRLLQSEGGGLSRDLFPCSIYPPVARHVDTKVLHAVVEALRERKAMVITYVGMKPGEEARERTIEPVELVHVFGRWHLHSFCYEAEGWRDFVLSRIVSISGFAVARFKWLATGGYQRTKVTASFSAHPALTADQRKAVEFEFGMDQGVLTQEFYQDFLFYFKKMYVAEEGEGPPQKLLIETAVTRT